MPNVGRGAALGVGKESTWGTAVSRTAWYRLVNATLNRDVANEERGNLVEASGSANIRKMFVAHDFISGQFELLLGYEGFGLLFENLMQGAPSTTGPSGGIYTHSYPLSASSTKSLTTEFLFGNGEAEVVEGVKINRATLAIEAGKQMRFICEEFIGETTGGMVSAGTFTATSNEVEVEHWQAGTVSFNSQTYTCVSVKISINHKLERRQLLGSKLTKEPLRAGFQEIMVELVVEYENSNLYTGYTAGTQSNIVFAFSGATGSRTLTFTGHNALLLSASRPINKIGVLQQTYKFRCLSDGTNEGLLIAVGNTQSSNIAA